MTEPKEVLQAKWNFEQVNWNHQKKRLHKVIAARIEVENNPSLSKEVESFLLGELDIARTKAEQRIGDAEDAMRLLRFKLGCPDERRR